jgi:hypothetical protein
MKQLIANEDAEVYRQHKRPTNSNRLLKTSFEEQKSSWVEVSLRSKLIRNKRLRPSLSWEIETPKHSFGAPRELKLHSDLSDELRAIRRDLLNCKNNWDDSGALAPHPDSINEVMTFLFASYKALEKKQLSLNIPEVNPFTNGSIDVVWRGQTAHLILNFAPQFPSKPAFYADRMDYTTGVNGRIDLNLPQTWEHVLLALETVHRDGLAN